MFNNMPWAIVFVLIQLDKTGLMWYTFSYVKLGENYYGKQEH